ncbi:hypothetical protein GE061_004824 [Apolygus lucorum]|uniref:Uncharacterized protein n=1 Tax=Apolygus lucorum TaxID=248454 RepID=A0A6A4J3T8_APOLU|nr:hypothetical protein GE061_004824 [Apolygus lucorum]
MFGWRSKNKAQRSMPSGSGAVLRARRSGVSVKPNRVLDKGSSRGMIYENEELRMRNINYNEELDKRE